MKKLKLNLEDLKVESFETSKKISDKGTVNGNDIITYANNVSCMYSCHADTCFLCGRTFGPTRYPCY